MNGKADSDEGYVLNAKGDQRHTNNQQVQQVEVVSTEGSFVQEGSKGHHLDGGDPTVKDKGGSHSCLTLSVFSRILCETKCVCMVI